MPFDLLVFAFFRKQTSRCMYLCLGVVLESQQIAKYLDGDNKQNKRNNEYLIPFPLSFVLEQKVITFIMFVGI